MSSKLCVLTWRGEEFYRNGSRGGDQLMDILLIGWWSGNRESASSTFWFQQVWGLCPCGQQTVSFSYLVGVSVCAKHLKETVLCIPWGGTRTLPQGCPVASQLLLPCLCTPSLSWLATVWTCPLELREGQGGWIKPISCKQEKGRYRKTFVPRSPTASCSVSLWTQLDKKAPNLFSLH